MRMGVFPKDLYTFVFSNSAGEKLGMHSVHIFKNDFSLYHKKNSRK